MMDSARMYTANKFTTVRKKVGDHIVVIQQTNAHECQTVTACMYAR